MVADSGRLHLLLEALGAASGFSTKTPAGRGWLPSSYTRFASAGSLELWCWEVQTCVCIATGERSLRRGGS